MVDNGSKNFSGSGLNAAGAMAILSNGSFNMFTAVVQGHVPASSSFTYHDNFGPIKFKPAMNQYFLEDKLEFLDQPEEWFYNKSTRTLYVMTSDRQFPEGRDVRGKSNDICVSRNKFKSNAFQEAHLLQREQRLGPPR